MGGPRHQRRILIFSLISALQSSRDQKIYFITLDIKMFQGLITVVVTNRINLDSHMQKFTDLQFFEVFVFKNHILSEYTNFR